MEVIERDPLGDGGRVVEDRRVRVLTGHNAQDHYGEDQLLYAVHRLCSKVTVYPRRSVSARESYRLSTCLVQGPFHVWRFRTTNYMTMC
jgi:hypothetical protein